jgi:hypothetical protein
MKSNGQDFKKNPLTIFRLLLGISILSSNYLRVEQELDGKEMTTIDAHSQYRKHCNLFSICGNKLD